MLTTQDMVETYRRLQAFRAAAPGTVLAVRDRTTSGLSTNQHQPGCTKITRALLLADRYLSGDATIGRPLAWRAVPHPAAAEWSGCTSCRYTESEV